MSVVRTVAKLIAPLQRRVAMMVARGVLDLVDDSTKMQLAQVKLLADEVAPRLERFQEYGFSSAPAAGAEAVVVFPNGVRSHGIIIAVDDRRYRMAGMEGGEVALYDDLGQAVHLKRDGIVLKSPLKVTAEAPEITLTAGSDADQVVTLGGEGVSLESPLKVAVKAPELVMTGGTDGDQLVTIGAAGVALDSPVNVAVTAPSATITATSAEITADSAKVFAADLQLGAAGGQPIARVGDSVAGGVITTGSSSVRCA